MVSAPELKKYMDKSLSIQLNANRKITGTLRGYDVFLNLTLENTIHIDPATGDKVQIGTSVVRGNSIQSIEVLDKI
ncbi:mRNA splicing protein [Saccharomycopsis crataegensis]|uniref:Small nuclear ribonucleoprotein G n=1 Tax=Saccharomycopsis crataegensis TaxID=43959 RepID=A0AAV5QUV7_9ASCO|nr:mRNA splicing protein [Saccharomycopsis crataegensis]